MAGFLIVNRSLKYRIRAAPAQIHTVVNISAKFVPHLMSPIFLLTHSIPFHRVEQCVASEADEHGDRRRIVHLFMTSVDKRPPIHFQTLPGTTD